MQSSDQHNPQTELARTGLRRTPVRLAVIQVLMRGDSPMSVPQILSRIKGVDTVTVYRTLHAFVRKRLVHRVRAGGEERSWLYAISDHAGRKIEHLHPHFVCDECGKVECLGQSRVPAESLLQLLGVRRAYRVRWPEVVLHGTCPKCHS